MATSTPSNMPEMASVTASKIGASPAWAVRLARGRAPRYRCFPALATQPCSHL
jgi:hypothetical protein